MEDNAGAPGPPGDNAPRRFIRNAAAAANAVATFVAAVFGGFFLGYFLDGRFGTSPVLTLVGSLLGTAGAAYLVVRETKRLLK